MRSSLPSKPSTPPTTSKAVSNGWKRRRWNPPNSSKPSRSPARTSKVPTLPPFSLVRPFAPDLLRLLPHLLLRLSDPPSPSQPLPFLLSWYRVIVMAQTNPPLPSILDTMGVLLRRRPDPLVLQGCLAMLRQLSECPCRIHPPPHQPSSRGSSRRRGRRVVFGPAFGAR